jgi:hypothetical protein
MRLIGVEIDLPLARSLARQWQSGAAKQEPPPDIGFIL